MYFVVKTTPLIQVDTGGKRPNVDVDYLLENLYSKRLTNIKPACVAWKVVMFFNLSVRSKCLWCSICRK